MSDSFKIDYLNFTHKHPEDLNPFAVLRRAIATVQEFSQGLEFGEITDKGLHGYSWSCAVTVKETGAQAGFLAAGGANFGTVFYTFNGKGCRHVSQYGVYALLNRLGGRVTRLDIAYDDLEGKRTPMDVRDAYRAGEFKNRGQTPKHDMAGPWESPEHWGDGLTFYVGKRDTGRMLRVYHKGRQLGDPHSPWVRFEVELTRKKRDIPLAALLDLQGAFIGAYPWLEWAAEEEGAPIGMVAQEEQKISVNHLISHAKRSYGKLLSVLTSLKCSPEHIVGVLSSVGTPRRLDRRYLRREHVTDSIKFDGAQHALLDVSTGEILSMA